jgi:von Willebrand factor type A domain
MPFLDLGPRSRRKLRLTEWTLMLVRMSLLALVALALARPFWMAPSSSSSSPSIGPVPARDVVLIFDGTVGMERRRGGMTTREAAVRWARRFVARLRPGDSVALLVTGARVRPVIDPPSFDKGRVDAALAGLGPSRVRGPADLPAALAEACRVLERAGNPASDVIVLGDGRRSAWRPDESRRWALLREIRGRLPAPPRVWSFAPGAGPDDAPNVAVGPLSMSRGLVTPGRPFEVATTLTNDGHAPLARTAELLLDGRPVPGASRAVGPIPAGGSVPLSFRTAIESPGRHAIGVWLAGVDALAVDDIAEAPVAVTSALPVLLVDGAPSLEPLRSPTDFLRAALAPTGDHAPPVRASVVPLDALDAPALRGPRVAVLAGVDPDRLSAGHSGALGRFLDAGGGLLIAPGVRPDAASPPRRAPGWIPASLGVLKGDADARRAVAHPAPSTFAGPALAPFAADPDSAATLAGADLFAYRVLAPAAGSTVAARLDTGDPWAVEGRRGDGRVLLLAAGLDAASGTLPANPDFVPLVHEWIFHLAGGASIPAAVRPGEPLAFDLDPDPGPSVTSLEVRTPAGATVRAPVVREPGASRPHARLDTPHTDEPGLYRLALPDPQGGTSYAYAAVSDVENGPADPAPLAPAEAARLAEGWPLGFESDPSRLDARLAETDHGGGGRREAWRGLVLAALAGLCLEVLLTRRLVRGQGAAGG